MAEQTEPKNTVEDGTTAAAPGDKRKLEPDISPEQASVIKKLKDGKIQPGKIAAYYLYTTIRYTVYLFIYV